MAGPSHGGRDLGKSVRFRVTAAEAESEQRRSARVYAEARGVAPAGAGIAARDCLNVA